MGQEPEALIPTAVLRLRPRRIVLRPRRRGAWHVYALAARAQARCRYATRARERAAVGLFAPASLAHQLAGGALSDELCGRAHHRVSRGAGEDRRAFLSAVLVSRS